MADVPLSPLRKRRVNGKTKNASRFREAFSSFLNLNLGGPCRARTYDPLIKSQLLYQLS